MNYTCIGCGKTPDQLSEYVEMAKGEETTPEQYMVDNEGTFNRFKKGKFYCTTCYIKAGMPTINK